MIENINELSIQDINQMFDDRTDPSRALMERTWFRNILYYCGEQYIDWLVSQETFVRRPQNPYLPTPVSNIIRDYANAMKAMILNKSYNVKVWQNSDDMEDKEASEVADDVLIWMDSLNEDAFEDVKEDLALWLVLFGTTFSRTFPEKQGGEWGFDIKGNPIPQGDVACEAIMPFMFRCDLYGSTLRKKRWAGIQSLKPKEWVEDTFEVLVNSDSDSSSIDYQKRLLKMVASISPWKGKGLESLWDDEIQDLVIFKEIELKPTIKKPDGRYVVAVGDKILLESESMPIKAKNGIWSYTFTDFHYFKVPGRFWSDPGVNDLISPQNTINSIDQDLEMNRKGFGRPVVMCPSDMNIQRANKGGQSFIFLKYDALLSGGQKPEISRGTTLSAQVHEERKTQLQVAQDAGGDPKGVLRGKSPGSQASGLLTDILRESAELGHAPDVARFYRALKRTYRKRLILAEEIYTEERIAKVMGKGHKLKIRKFKGSDLRGNTDVHLELDNKISSTRAGQGKALSEVAKSGVFGDVSTQPGLRRELLEVFGLSDIQEDSNIHLKKAEEENRLIAEATEDTIILEELPNKTKTAFIEGLFTTAEVVTPGQQPERQVFGKDSTFYIHNHRLHMPEHVQFVLSPEFKELDPIVQEIAIRHIDEHKTAIEKEEEEMMAKQAKMAEMEAAAKKSEG